MYGITSEKAIDIATANWSLPRFQRKRAWGDKERFKLCISIFKKYPIGTVVIKKENLGEGEDSRFWLLDGRQRRDTIREIPNSRFSVARF